MKRIVTLTHITEITIDPVHPFNFLGTVYKPSHFPLPTSYFDNETLWFSMNHAGQFYGLRLRRIDIDGLRLTIFSEQSLDQSIIDDIVLEVRYRFDLDLELSEFISVAENDPILKSVESKWRGMRVSCPVSLFELLCITVVLQNAQISRSSKMLNSLLENYGHILVFDNRELITFWLPEEMKNINEDELRDLKVGYRAKTFIKIAQFFSEEPNYEYSLRELSKSDADKQLRRIYGVGPATAWYLLFEKLHHYDAFDHISPWESKIMCMIVFGNLDSSPESILAFAQEKWGEWRMLAVHYLFENIFWDHKQEQIAWLAKLIRM